MHAICCRTVSVWRRVRATVQKHPAVAARLRTAEPTVPVIPMRPQQLRPDKTQHDSWRWWRRVRTAVRQAPSRCCPVHGRRSPQGTRRSCLQSTTSQRPECEETLSPLALTTVPQRPLRTNRCTDKQKPCVLSHARLDGLATLVVHSTTGLFLVYTVLYYAHVHVTRYGAATGGMISLRRSARRTRRRRRRGSRWKSSPQARARRAAQCASWGPCRARWHTLASARLGWVSPPRLPAPPYTPTRTSHATRAFMR